MGEQQRSHAWVLPDVLDEEWATPLICAACGCVSGEECAGEWCPEVEHG